MARETVRIAAIDDMIVTVDGILNDLRAMRERYIQQSEVPHPSQLLDCMYLLCSVHRHHLFLTEQLMDRVESLEYRELF